MRTYGAWTRFHWRRPVEEDLLEHSDGYRRPDLLRLVIGMRKKWRGERGPAAGTLREVPAAAAEEAGRRGGSIVSRAVLGGLAVQYPALEQRAARLSERNLRAASRVLSASSTSRGTTTSSAFRAFLGKLLSLSLAKRLVQYLHNEMPITLPPPLS